MRNIYIMSGVPGSGKSTWMHRHAGVGDYMLSRDLFRAALRNMLGKPDEYFPCSANEEYIRWAENIRKHMTQFPEANIYIDQTTLTQGALNRLLSNIAPALTDNDFITVVRVLCNEQTCLERNAKRTGWERVPDNVIASMAKSMREAPITTDGAAKHLKKLGEACGVEVIYENMED